MKKFCIDLAEILKRFSPNEGLNPGAVPGTHCIKFSEVKPRTKQRWHASFCVAAQGCKEIILDQKIYRCREGQYVVIPLDLPVVSRISEATFKKPFLSLKIDFDPLLLSEVASQNEIELAKDSDNRNRAIFIGEAPPSMFEAAIRLAKLFETPEDARALGPLIIKEMSYHLLKGPDGPAIRQFVRSGSKMHKISEAIYNLRSELTEEVDVESLAKAANMSRSAFFKHFKEVTSMSPIQYQKKLRLLEARRLLIDEGETAEGSAYKVGYNSASQFSREYSRMFGKSPIRDIS